MTSRGPRHCFYYSSSTSSKSSSTSKTAGQWFVMENTSSRPRIFSPAAKLCFQMKISCLFREFKQGVDTVERELADLFDQFLVLQEESFLKLNENKFTSDDLPRIGDICHIKSLPRHHYFSLGVVFHIEASSDSIPRTFWLRVMRPRQPSHPFPLGQPTSFPEAFRRDSQDLILILRREELSTSLTNDFNDFMNG